MKSREIHRLHGEVLNGIRDFAWPEDDYRGSGLREECASLLWARLLDLKRQGHPLNAESARSWAINNGWYSDDAGLLAGVVWAVEHCV